MSEIDGLKRRLVAMGCGDEYAGTTAARMLSTAFRGDSNPDDEAVAGEINRALDEIEGGDVEEVALG